MAIRMIRGSTSWLALTLTAALSACSGFGGAPREPGWYAVEGETLHRLDGDRDWEQKTWKERSNFAPSVSFVLRDSRVAALGTDFGRVIQLHRVGWLRSEITQEGDILPVSGSQWVDADIEELRVPVRLQTDAENEEVIRVIPQQPLDPGLYTLRAQFPSARIEARAGVGWPAVDRRSYAAASCVDRYPGSTERYRPCVDQQQAVASASLKIHLVKPELRNVPGYARQLIVKGVVVNTSDRSHQIPPLKAHLVTEEGIVVKRWEFNADAVELPPGASAAFESRVPAPPAGASNVQVTFSALDSNLDGTASTTR